MYKSLVRLILEYASPVWSPFLVKDIVHIFGKSTEKSIAVGLRSAKGQMPYEDRYKALRWSSLSDGRLYFSLIECYKTEFELNNLRFGDYFELASKVTRSNNSYKLQVKMAKCNCHKYSFFVRIVLEKNNLPCYVVEAGNLRRFKSTLKS